MSEINEYLRTAYYIAMIISVPPAAWLATYLVWDTIKRNRSTDAIKKG